MQNKEIFIQQHIQTSIEVQRKMAEEQTGILAQIADTLIHTIASGGIIYLCGNGGSAADAQHVAAELIGRYLRERKAAPAVALTTDTSVLTAIGNDYDFAQVFVRQVHALMTPKDTLVGISTSGKSPNVLLAIAAARQLGAQTIGFTGTPGEPLASEAALCLRVPSRHTPHVQEAHITAWHIVCDLVEQSLIPKE
jgi:D-sedoheptulose 7-phosphate isomerase